MADAAEIGTTIIIYSLCVWINPHQQRWRQAKPESRLYVLCAPFSFVPPASKASHLPFLLQCKLIVRLSRTTHRAGGHVAWLVSSETEFRGRPPSQCGVDVRSCVSCRSHCYLFVYAHKRILRHQGLVAESVLYECMWILENIWVKTRRLCSFWCWMVIKSNLLCFYSVGSVRIDRLRDSGLLWWRGAVL